MSETHGYEDTFEAAGYDRRHEICATVYPEILLGEPSPSETAEIRVEFDCPDDAEHGYYELQ